MAAPIDVFGLSMSDAYSWSATSLSEGARREVAALICESLPELYELVGHVGGDPVAAAIAQMDVPGSEVGNVRVATKRGRIIGVCATIPAAGLARAQLIGTGALLSSVGPVQRKDLGERIKVFRGQIPKAPTTGNYLTRIAVVADARGTGASDWMMRELLTVGALSLHVRRDNTRAIAFYRRHGLVQVADDGGAYVAMATP